MYRSLFKLKSFLKMRKKDYCFCAFVLFYFSSFVNAWEIKIDDSQNEMAIQSSINNSMDSVIYEHNPPTIYYVRYVSLGCTDIVGDIRVHDVNGIPVNFLVSCRNYKLKTLSPKSTEGSNLLISEFKNKSVVTISDSSFSTVGFDNIVIRLIDRLKRKERAL